MKTSETNRVRVFVLSIGIILSQMIIFSLLWGNPLVKEMMALYANHPSVKAYDFIGGEMNWKLIRLFFHVMFMVLSIWIYLHLFSNIPGRSWKKGFCFGALIGFFRFVPEAFNLWTMVSYPEGLILLRLVLGVVSFIVFGVLVSVILEKYGTIGEEQ